MEDFPRGTGPRNEHLVRVLVRWLGEQDTYLCGRGPKVVRVVIQNFGFGFVCLDDRRTVTSLPDCVVRVNGCDAEEQPVSVGYSMVLCDERNEVVEPVQVVKDQLPLCFGARLDGFRE